MKQCSSVCALVYIASEAAGAGVGSNSGSSQQSDVVNSESMPGLLVFYSHPHLHLSPFFNLLYITAAAMMQDSLSRRLSRPHRHECSIISMRGDVDCVLLLLLFCLRFRSYAASSSRAFSARHELCIVHWIFRKGARVRY